MDTLLAIASRRDERRYEPDPLPDDVVTRILDAGRLAGSASNRQPWTFVLPEGDDRREALIMRFALGMDNREIARALGRSDGATKVLIHRAIKQLEEQMADE